MNINKMTKTTLGLDVSSETIVELKLEQIKAKTQLLGKITRAKHTKVKK